MILGTIVRLELIVTWDNVAPALRALDPMLEAVAVGRFKPDCTRSGMFVGSRDLEAKFPCLPRAARTRRTGISPPRMRPSTQSWDLGSRWLGCEMRLGTSSEEGTHFKCGRKITSSYTPCESMPEVLFPVCKQCCPDVKVFGEAENE